MHPPQRKDLTIFRRALLPRSRTTLGSLDSRPTLNCNHRRGGDGDEGCGSGCCRREPPSPPAACGRFFLAGSQVRHGFEWKSKDRGAEIDPSVISDGVRRDEKARCRGPCPCPYCPSARPVPGPFPYPGQNAEWDDHWAEQDFAYSTCRADSVSRRLAIEFP
jgi:hypothetical protein